MKTTNIQKLTFDIMNINKNVRLNTMKKQYSQKEVNAIFGFELVE